MQEHVCIKPGCGTKYQDEEPDAYYCPSCNEEKKVIAREVDSKISTLGGKKGLSELEEYDELRKANGGRYPSTNQLGIKLE